MNSAQLTIVITAINEAKAALAEADAQLTGLGDTAEETATKTDAASASSSKSSTAFSDVGKAALIGAAGAAVLGGVSVKMASDFQTSMTQLTTSAGESQGNLKGVAAGALKIAADTGVSLKDLAEGTSSALYVVESAGFHGAAQTNAVLQAVAEGAKIEGASVGTVADAVTSAMVDYHQSAGQAATTTSELIAAVGQGKTNLQDFSGALHSVLPTASDFHIKMSDILGDLASMTSHGMSADQATQNMAEAIKKLSAPTTGMTQELANFGIQSSSLIDDLGTKGLSGTLQMVSDAIMNKTGPAGKTMISLFNNNKVQAEDTAAAFMKLSPALQGIANSYMSGSMTVEQYRTTVKGLNGDQQNLLGQYVTMAKNSTGFSAAIKAGKNPLQDYQQALQAATGDATTFNVAQMLTGQNASRTNTAIAAVSKASADAGNHVHDWAQVQKNFNQQMSEARSSIEVTGVAIGTALLPAAMAMLKVIMDIIKPIAEFATAHKTAAAVIFLLVGGLLIATAAFVGLVKGIKSVTTAVTDVGAAFDKIVSMLTIQTTATEGATEAQEGLNLAFMANPVFLVVAAIVALIAILVILIVKVKPVRDFFIGMWNDIKQGVGIATKAISDAFGDTIKWLSQNWPVVLAVILGPMGLAIDFIVKNWKSIETVAKDVMGVVTSAVRVAVDIIVGIFKFELSIYMYVFDVMRALALAFWNWLYSSLIKPVIGFIVDAFNLMYQAWVAVGAFERAVALAVWNFIWANIIQPVLNLIVAGFNALKSPAEAVWNVIKSSAQAAWNFIAGIWGGVANWFKGIWDSISKGAGNLGSAMGTAFSTGLNSVMGIAKGIFNGIIGGVNAVINTINGSVGKLPGVPKIADIPHLASGTSGFQGGMALVGEQGPELINMPQGTQVFSAPQTSSMMSGGQTLNANVTVNVGVYAGQPGELNNIAISIYQALQRVARQHGMLQNMPELGIVPQ